MDHIRNTIFKKTYLVGNHKISHRLFWETRNALPTKVKFFRIRFYVKESQSKVLCNNLRFLL